MKIDVLLGLQWGDEGKGKIVDVLTPKYDIIARFQGGPNAGHTLVIDGEKYVLHTIPSGIFHEGVLNVIGNGVVLDPVILVREIRQLIDKGVDVQKKLLVAKKAHIILPTHRSLDAAYEQYKGKAKIGSTLKGIGPTYTDKISRNGIRIGDIMSSNFKEKYDALKQKHIDIIKLYNSGIEDHLIDGQGFSDYEIKWFEAIDFIRTLQLIDSEHYINDALKQGKKILAEGAQGAMLDIDFGSYPFVTSSNTICAGACTGLGVSPKMIGKVYGIFKAYCTRVGSGPFPTELNDEAGQTLRDIGREYGSTTGRPRRCGWLDMPILKYSIMVNGVTELLMMKGDVMNTFETIKICDQYNVDGKEYDYLPFEASEENLVPKYKDMTGWNTNINEIRNEEDFPKELNDYVDYIEKETGIPISVVSVGPDREETILKEKQQVNI